MRFIFHSAHGRVHVIGRNRLHVDLRRLLRRCFRGGRLGRLLLNRELRGSLRSPSDADEGGAEQLGEVEENGGDEDDSLAPETVGEEGDD